MHLELKLSHLYNPKLGHLLICLPPQHHAKRAQSQIVLFFLFLCLILRKTSNDKTDYAELLFPQRHLNPNTSLPPHNSLHPSTSHPVSQEDIPPALPYRPNNLRNSSVLPPNRLYPCLEEKGPHVISPFPATVTVILVDLYTLSGAKIDVVFSFFKV